MKEAYIKLKLKAPRYPNYVSFEGNEDVVVDIGKLTAEELEDYADIWRQGLIDHGSLRRKALEPDKDEHYV